MSTIYALELDLATYKHIAWHKFELNGYRNSMKFNAFFHSLKARNVTATRQYTARDQQHFDIEVRSHARENYPMAPMIEHANLDDFFNHIGYNYKRKKII